MRPWNDGERHRRRAAKGGYRDNKDPSSEERKEYVGGRTQGIKTNGAVSLSRMRQDSDDVRIPQRHRKASTG